MWSVGFPPSTRRGERMTVKPIGWMLAFALVLAGCDRYYDVLVWWLAEVL